MAGVSFILAFFFVSLRFSKSASHGYCPKSFECGELGQIQFPLFNNSYDGCGMLQVNCSDKSYPRIHLDRGAPWGLYEVKQVLSNNSIKVRSEWLRNTAANRSCDIFAYWDIDYALPNSHSINSTITSPSLTFFRCPSSTDLKIDEKINDYFRGNHSYKCPGNTVYYSDSYNSLPDFLKSYCHRSTLPSVPSTQKRNFSDLFSLLVDEFTIRLDVTTGDCKKCLHKGGQCTPYSKVEFNCINEGRSRLKLILGTAAAAAAGIGIAILAILFLFIKRKLSFIGSTIFKNKTDNCRKVEDFLKNYGSHFPRRYTYSEITRLTNSFREKLGQGGFGCVFKGKLDNGFLVAVKVFKTPRDSGEEFINEIAAISRTSHVNIVNLLGFCFEGHNRALVYEFMPNGSLERFIYKGESFPGHQFCWETLYKIAIGIARGLEYLHRGCNMRILHFDIKPHNILLDEDFCPKISDFGLAKLCPEKESRVSLLGARGTAGYIAPEVFSKHFGIVSHKSDVYSYGMMIIEMAGGKKNIEVEADHSSEIYFPHWIYKRLELNEELGLNGLVSKDSNKNARKMIIVGLWCIQIDPSHRPSISTVVEMLEGNLRSLQIPPKPYLFSPSRSPLLDSSTTILSRARSLDCA